RNDLGQPIGAELPAWQPPPLPPRQALGGRFCRVEPLDASRHAADLFAANAHDQNGKMWTYLPYGPFPTMAEYQAWLAERAASADQHMYAIVVDGRACGVAAYLRMTPAAGSIEVGHLAFSPLLQRTPAATEAMYLMMHQIFGLGYRRYEWKCDTLNLPSRAAARRLGFSYEGVFRQAVVYKGRNRDTAWYAILDHEWPALERSYRRWLDPANFDDAGNQQVRLAELIRHERTRE
ncbi:MAG TPA: GNAT family protein, partial [Roseiflexaceae bacterium]|nr:GNAT family protein [Roseiflexaceae bacterium]